MRQKGRKYKTFGITLLCRQFEGHRQVRAIVAANSRTHAARLFCVTYNKMRDHGSETGNAAEIAAAEASPWNVLVRPLYDPTHPYVEWTENHDGV